jgi:hypothetical protein
MIASYYLIAKADNGRTKQLLYIALTVRNIALHSPSTSQMSAAGPGFDGRMRIIKRRKRQNLTFNY